MAIASSTAHLQLMSGNKPKILEVWKVSVAHNYNTWKKASIFIKKSLDMLYDVCYFTAIFF